MSDYPGCYSRIRVGTNKGIAKGTSRSDGSKGKYRKGGCFRPGSDNRGRTAFRGDYDRKGTDSERGNCLRGDHDRKAANSGRGICFKRGHSRKGTDNGSQT